MSRTLIASDNFNRAPASNLGANWDQNTAETTTAIIADTGDSAQPSDNSADTSATWNANVSPNDQYAKITIGASVGGLGSGIGLVVRSSITEKTFYRYVVSDSGYELARFIDHAFVGLASGSGTTFAAADTAALEVTGQGTATVLKMFKNDVQIGSNVADSGGSALNSGRFGVAHSSTTTAGLNKINSWEGGSVTADGVTPPKLGRLIYSFS